MKSEKLERARVRARDARAIAPRPFACKQLDAGKLHCNASFNIFPPITYHETHADSWLSKRL